MNTNIIIFERLKIFLDNSLNNREKYCINDKVFIRDRILTFSITCFLLINMLRRTLAIELYDFFDLMYFNTECSKSAFSQSRYKLKYQFFIDWNYELVRLYYSLNDANIKRWKGFRVLGVDGSTMYLFNKKEIIEYFGVQTNQSTAIPMARIMLCHDVLNKISIHSKIMPIKNGEMDTAKEWLDLYEKDVLSIYDRGFAGFEFLFLNIHKQQNFVVRFPVSFNNEIKKFVKSAKQDEVVEFKITKYALKKLLKSNYKVDSSNTIKIRLLRIILDTGDVEVLGTTLLDAKEYPHSCFKDLYWLRWGVETQYDVLKNILQMEIFSGLKVEAVKQDFYATVFTANINSLIINECEPKLKEKSEGCKLEWQINRNVAIGLLKYKIVGLFLDENPEQIINTLKNRLLKNLTTKGKCDNKNREAKMRKMKGKYQTFSNYKRAI